MKQDINFKNHFVADDGMVFRRKGTDNSEFLSNSIWLSHNDNIENYEEIEEVLDQEHTADEINTMEYNFSKKEGFMLWKN